MPRQAPARLLAFDLDGTLVDPKTPLAPLYERLAARSSDTSLAYITGRTYTSAEQLLRSHNLPWPDVLATGLGTEIRWGPSAQPDRAWRRRMGTHFSPGRLQRVLKGLHGLRLQPAEALHAFKLSYWVEAPEPDIHVAHVARLLRQQGLRAKLVYSSSRDLDLIPAAAGKGAALRWIAQRLGVSLQATFACGDSGNDLDMLLTAGMAAVVANAEPGLTAQLPPEVYRAGASVAEGAHEGLQYWLGSEAAW